MFVNSALIGNLVKLKSFNSYFVFVGVLAHFWHLFLSREIPVTLLATNLIAIQRNKSLSPDLMRPLACHGFLPYLSAALKKVRPTHSVLTYYLTLKCSVCLFYRNIHLNQCMFALWVFSLPLPLIKILTTHLGQSFFAGSRVDELSDFFQTWFIIDQLISTLTLLWLCEWTLAIYNCLLKFISVLHETSGYVSFSVGGVYYWK